MSVILLAGLGFLTSSLLWIPLSARNWEFPNVPPMSENLEKVELWTRMPRFLIFIFSIEPARRSGYFSADFIAFLFGAVVLHLALYIYLARSSGDAGVGASLDDLV